MFEEYQDGNTIFEVSPDRLQDFLKQYPNAQKRIKETETPSIVLESEYIGEPLPTTDPPRQYITFNTTQPKVTNNKGQVLRGGLKENFVVYKDEYNPDDYGMSFEEYAKRMGVDIKEEKDSDFEVDESIEPVVLGEKKTRLVPSDKPTAFPALGAEVVEDEIESITPTKKSKALNDYRSEFLERMKFIKPDNYKNEAVSYVFDSYTDKVYKENAEKFRANLRIDEGETFKDEASKTIGFGNVGRRILKRGKDGVVEGEYEQMYNLLQEQMPAELFSMFEQVGFDSSKIDYSTVMKMAEENPNIRNQINNFIQETKAKETTYIQNKYSNVLSTDQMYLAIPQPNPDWNTRQNRVASQNEEVKKRYRAKLAEAGFTPDLIAYYTNNMEFGSNKIPDQFQAASMPGYDDDFILQDPKKAISPEERKAYFKGLEEFEKNQREIFKQEINNYNIRNAPVVQEIADMRSQIESINVDDIKTDGDADYYNSLIEQYNNKVAEYATSDLAQEGLTLYSQSEYLADIGNQIMNQANMQQNVDLAAYGAQFNYNNLDKFIATIETQLLAPGAMLGASIINRIAEGIVSGPFGNNPISQVYNSADEFLSGEEVGDIMLGTSKPDYTGLKNGALNYYKAVTEDYEKEFAPPIKISDVMDDRSAANFGDWLSGATAENGLTIAQVLGPSLVARVSVQLQKQAFKKALTKGKNFDPDLYKLRPGGNIANKEDWIPNVSAGKGYYKKKPGKELFFDESSLDSRLFDLTIKKKALQRANNVTMASFFTATGGGEMGRLEASFQKAESELVKLRAALAEEKDPSKQNEILSQIDYYENVADSAAWQRTFQGLLFGTTEMYAEKFGTLRYVNDVRFTRNMYGRKGLEDTFTKGWRNTSYWKNRAKDLGAGTYNLGYGVAIENVEEILTAAGHGLIKRTVVGSNDPVLKEVNMDLIANTTFASLMMQSPNTASNVYNFIRYESSTYSDYQRAVQYGTERAKIQEQLNDLNITPEKRKELNKKMEKLNQLVRLDSHNKLMRYNRLSDKNKELYLELRAKQNFQEKQLYQIAGSANFGQDGFAENFEAAKKRVLKTNDQLQEVLTDTRSRQKYKDKLKELKKFNEDGGLNLSFVNPEVANANRLLYETAKEMAELLSEKQVISFSSAQEIESFIKTNNISDSVAEELRKMGYAYNDPNGNIYLNENNIYSSLVGVNSLELGLTFMDAKDVIKALKTGEVETNILTQASTYEQFRAAIAPLHEVIHDEIDRRKIFSGVYENAKEAAMGISNVLKNKVDSGQLDRGIYEKITKIIDKYKNEDGEVVDASEFITVLGEAMLGGYLSVNDLANMHGVKSFLNNIFRKLGPLGSAMVDITDPFGTPQDMYNFMAEYVRKQIVKGDVTAVRIPEEEKERLKLETEGRQSVANVDAPRLDKKKFNLQNLTNEQLIRKLKNAKGYEKQVIEDILIDAAARVGLRTMGFDSRAGLGNITYEEGYQVARERVVDRGLLNKFDPRINDNWSTYAGSQLKFDLTDVIERNKKKLDTESTDSEIAKQVEDTTDTTTEVVEETAVEEVEPTIDIFDILPPEIRQEAQEEIDRKIKDNNIDLGDANLTFKELQQIAPYETLAKYFGIPVSRITQPSDNLRKGDDISKIQMFILKNVDRLINTRPKGNADVVQTKAVGNLKAKLEGGQSAGIRSRNFLNTEYDKVLDAKGRQKKINNNLQYRIKPGNRNRFLKASGITNNKVDKNYIPRGPESQYIKGVLELLARNMALTGFGQAVDQQQDQAVQEETTTPEKAATRKATVRQKTAPAKAPLLRFSQMANEVEKIINIRGDFNLDEKGIDRLLENLKLDKTFDLRKSDGRTKFIEVIKKNLLPLMPKEFWFSTRKDGKVTGSAFTASNKTYGLSMGNKEEADAYNAFKDEIFAIGNNPETKFGKPIEYKDENGKTITVDLKSVTKNYKTIFGDKTNYKDKIVKGFEDGSIDTWNKSVAAIHKEMWKRFNKALNSENRTAEAQAIGTYLKLVANDTSSWHKLGAQLVGYSKELQQRKEGKALNIEFEHAMPATAAYLYLMDAALQDQVDFNTAYDLVIDNYKLIVLDKAMDDKLRNARTASGYSLQRRMPDNWSVVDGKWWQRYFNEIVAAQNGGIDPNSIIGLDGKSFAETFKVDAKGQPTTKEIEDSKQKAAKPNAKRLPKQVAPKRQSVSNNEILDRLGNLQKAFLIAQNPNNESKGISVYDFDDTLAFSKSKIIVTFPDGRITKITPAEFATDSVDLEAQGAVFNFEEFNKVVGGKPGPLAARLKKAIDKFGNKNIYVLTARPAAAAPAIYEFLKGIGLEIPLNNIVGLEDGSPQAKADWIISKAAQGFNDFYFVDDAVKNVKAVQDALNILDVKSKVQVARRRNSVQMDNEFNEMIERKTGIKSHKEYSKAKAALVGKTRKDKKFFIPPSADDFVGLLYSIVGQGKQGDADLKWINENLLMPFAYAMQAISQANISMQNDYKALKKELKIVPKDLRKKIPGSVFNKEQAVRIYIWNKQGMSVPGLSKSDLKEIDDYINENEYLKVFADQLINILKGEKYAKPREGWLAGSITTDLFDTLQTDTRAMYLQDWQRNVDVIFSEKNLNKLEAAFGKPYRVALENILKRMKTGINRTGFSDKLTSNVTDWFTNSIGVIMFFNTRSALLQTISSVNFINLEDNNIIAAGKAFADQKQYWKDFMMIMNSPFLKERRGGLRFNVNESDIADMARKDGMRGVVAKLLQLGFLPTQIADSVAIATGGATFYRNRVNTYIKEGFSQSEAQEKAFIDFREIAEESQQSSRPDRISMQQAGPLGRLILAFANTPMQYARLIGKAIDDLKNRRGNWKSSVSKVIHYSIMQNLIFTATQQALFAIGMGDFDEEDKEQKYVGTANNMMDGLLRGLGFAGAVASVIKNAILRGVKESKKSRPEYEKIAYELSRISPPISSKYSKITQVGRALNWDMDDMQSMGWDIQNPAYLAAAQVIAVAFNIPLDRAVIKARNIDDALYSDLQTWERLALIGGWRAWELGLEDRIRPKKKKRKKRKPNVLRSGVKIKGVKIN